MKLILLISLLSVIIYTSSAAVARGFYKDPKHPGKCVVAGFILSVGEDAQTPGNCERISCGEDGTVAFYTCGVIAPPPGYKLGEPIDASAPYPKCCEIEFVPN